MDPIAESPENLGKRDTMATLKDVAKKAGVSVSAVSHVINGYDDINAKTRARILAAIEKLGYHRNALARGLVNKRSELIGLVMFGEGIRHPFFQEVVQGVVAAIEACDRNVIFSTVSQVEFEEAPIFRKMFERRLEGLIVMGVHEKHPAVPKILDSGIPAMFIDVSVQRERAANVRSDNFGGAFAAARHLLELGHTRIAFMNEVADAAIFHDREAGFAAALAGRGLKPDGAHVVRSSNRLDLAFRAALKLLSRHKDDITAVMTVSDRQAIGVLQACAELGIKVPDDLSVVGFDDIDLAATTSPPLTTVRQQGEEIGSEAASELMRMIEDESYRPNEIVLPTELVVRRSTSAVTRDGRIGEQGLFGKGAFTGDLRNRHMVWLRGELFPSKTLSVNKEVFGMKRLALAFTVVLFILAQGSIALAAANEIVFWVNNINPKQALDAVKGPFEKDFGVKIKVEVVDDMKAAYITAATAGKGPDALSWAHDVVGEFAESGLISPVEMPKSLRDKFLPVALEGFTYKGKLYGYPYGVEAVALIYNKALVPKPPKTMEELAEMARKLTKDTNGDGKVDQYGFLYDVNNFYFSFPVLSGAGGYVFKSKDGDLDVNDVGLSNAGAIAGAKFIRKLVEDDLLPASTDYGAMDSLMKAGKLGMEINGPWALGDLRAAGINYGIANIPGLRGGTARPFVGVYGYMINRNSKNKDLVVEFLQNYLSKPDVQVAMYKFEGRAPALKEAYNALDDKPDVKAISLSAANGFPMPNVPQMAAVWVSMADALRLITSGKETPEKALKNATDQIEKAVAKK